MPDLVSYAGVLPIGESTVVRMAQLLDTERRRRRTRRDRRALGAWRQAVRVPGWFLDATRVAQRAVEDQISVSTAYRYLHEGIDVLAAVAPGLQGAKSMLSSTAPSNFAPGRNAPRRSAPGRMAQLRWALPRSVSRRLARWRFFSSKVTVSGSALSKSASCGFE